MPNTAGTGNTIANWLLAGMVWNTNELRTNPNVQQRWKDYEAYIADSYKVNSRVTADVGLRFTHFTAPYAANDAMASFDPSTINPAFGNSPCNGLLYVPGNNPCAELGFAGGTDGPNRSLRPTKAILIAPRLGVAWDVFGTGKTAVRGGVGLFYARERLSMGLGLGTNPPFSGTASVDRTLDSNQVIAGQTGLSFGAPGSGLEQSDANPKNWQWNVSVQHELLRNTVLEVAYVGNKGVDLLGVQNANEVAPQNRVAYARTGSAALRPLNGIAGIGDGNLAFWTHDRSSIYHGLQTALVSRFGRASVASLSYTWSKSLANTGLANADAGLTALNAYTDTTQPGLDRGRVRRRQDTHLLRQPRPGPAHLRGQVRLPEARPRRLGVHEHRPGVLGVSAHRVPRQRSRPLRERQQPRGHGLWRRPAAQPRPRRSLPGQRWGGDAVAESGGVDASTTSCSAPTATLDAGSARAPGSSRWTPPCTRTSGSARTSSSSSGPRCSTSSTGPTS